MKKSLLYILLASAAVAGCEKINPGFISDQMRYKDNAIYCKRGMALVQSDVIDADQSTPPIIYKMLNLREKATGKPAPAQFTTDYDVLVFKQGLSFNPETDTTVAELDKKREIQKLKPMYFNEKSGQFTFNRGSVNIPEGEYIFDIQASNIAGVRMFEKFGTLIVSEPTTEDIFQRNASASAAFNDVTGVSANTKDPVMKLTKLSNEGARLILKIADKTGKAFNPKAGEIIKRGDRPIFENYAKFNPVIITDTAMICDFEVAPFPMANYIDNTGYNWNHLMYYRIPSQYCIVDGYTQGGYSYNPRWDFQLKLEGTYLLEIRATDVTHR